MIPTWRDYIRKISPPWLQRGRAEKVLYAIGIHADAFGDALHAAVLHRFPGAYRSVYRYESLRVIGRERRISRGALESDQTYAVRLRRWFMDHRQRGGPYALLAQLHAYYNGANFPIDLIYRSGRTFSMDAEGNVTRTTISWSPDAQPEKWARWWLFYYTDQFGLTPSAAALKALRLVPRQWIAAHCLGWIVLLGNGVELWNFPHGHVWNESDTWNTAGGTITISVE